MKFFKTAVVILLALSLFSNLRADGTEPTGNPRVVSTLNHLLWISTNSSSWGDNFIQTANIDASSTSGWNAGEGFSPIGNSSVKFTGVYDGDEHSISGIMINRLGEDYQGVFGFISQATIKNLGLSSVDIIGGSYTGGLAGKSYYSSLITNCFVKGDVSATDAGSIYLGGLVGVNQSSTIRDCYSHASTDGQNTVGGLVGFNQNSTISNSFSIGSVTGTTNAGGLIGEGISQTVTSSFWDIENSGQASSVGGIGRTTAKMRDYYTFWDTGWDFLDEATNGEEEIWAINTDYGTYPFLSWETLLPNVLPHFEGGDGSAGNPYQVKTLNQLYYVVHHLEDNFIQVNNINASATSGWNSGEGWLPIGDNSDSFIGSYNGNGKTISGLTISRPAGDYQGLFGFIDGAELENIALLNISITGNSNIAGLVGYSNSSAILECYTTGSVSGIDKVAGLVGVNNSSSTIDNSYSNVTVSSTGSNTGGLVAINGNSSSINNCYATGSVSGNSVVGGLIGSNNYSTLTYSYSTGTVT